MCEVLGSVGFSEEVRYWERTTAGSLCLPPACGSEVSSQLLFQCLACYLPAIMFPTMMVMRSLSQTVSNPSIKCFLMSVSLVMMFLNRNKLLSKTQAINYLILISILRNKVKIVKGNYGSNLHNKGNIAQSAIAERHTAITVYIKRCEASLTYSSLTHNPRQSNEEHHTPDVQHTTYLGEKKRAHHR